MRHLLGFGPEPWSHPLSHLVTIVRANNRCAAVCCSGLSLPEATHVVLFRNQRIQQLRAAVDGAGGGPCHRPVASSGVTTWAWNWHGGRLGAVTDNMERAPDPEDSLKPLLQLRAGAPQRYDASAAMTGPRCAARTGRLPRPDELLRGRGRRVPVPRAASVHQRCGAPARRPKAEHRPRCTRARHGGRYDREEVARATPAIGPASAHRSRVMQSPHRNGVAGSDT